MSNWPSKVVRSKRQMLASGKSPVMMRARSSVLTWNLPTRSTKRGGLPGSAVLTRSAIGLTSSWASHQAAREDRWAAAGAAHNKTRSLQATTGSCNPSVFCNSFPVWKLFQRLLLTRCASEDRPRLRFGLALKQLLSGRRSRTFATVSALRTLNGDQRHFHCTCPEHLRIAHTIRPRVLQHARTC